MTSKALIGCRTTVASKWKKLGMTQNLPRIGRPSRPIEHLGKKEFGFRGEEEPNGHSEIAPKVPCRDGRTCCTDNHLCRNILEENLLYSAHIYILKMLK